MNNFSDAPKLASFGVLAFNLGQKYYALRSSNPNLFICPGEMLARVLSISPGSEDLCPQSTIWTINNSISSPKKMNFRQEILCGKGKSPQIIYPWYIIRWESSRLRFKVGDPPGGGGWVRLGRPRWCIWGAGAVLTNSSSGVALYSENRTKGPRIVFYSGTFLGSDFLNLSNL